MCKAHTIPYSDCGILTTSCLFLFFLLSKLNSVVLYILNSCCVPGHAGSRVGAVKTQAVSWVCVLVAGGAHRKVSVTSAG